MTTALLTIFTASVQAAPASANAQSAPGDDTAVASVESDQIDITGTTLDIEGNVVAGAFVTVFAWPLEFAEDEEFSLIPLGLGVSDESGHFSITPDYEPLWADIEASTTNIAPQLVDVEVVAESDAGVSSYSTTVVANPLTEILELEVIETAQQNALAGDAEPTVETVAATDEISSLALSLDESEATLDLAIQLQPVDDASADEGGSGIGDGASLGYVNPLGTVLGASLASVVDPEPTPSEPTPSEEPEDGPDGSGSDDPPPTEPIGCGKGCSQTDGQPTALHGCFMVRNLGAQWTVVGAIGSTTNGYTGYLQYTAGANTSTTAGFSSTGAYGSFTASGTTSRSSSGTVTFPTYSNSGYRMARTQFSYGVFRCAWGTTGTSRWVTRMTGFVGGSAPWSGTIPTASYCTRFSAGSGFTRNTSVARTFTAAVTGVHSQIGFNMSATTGYSSATAAVFNFSSSRLLCGTGGYPGGNPGVLIVKP